MSALARSVRQKLLDTWTDSDSRFRRRTTDRPSSGGGRRAPGRLPAVNRQPKLSSGSIKGGPPRRTCLIFPLRVAV